MIALDDATALYSSLLLHAQGLTGNRTAAEDIVQEAYLCSYEKPPPLCENPDQFRAWMKTVIKNLAYHQRIYQAELTVLPSDEWDGASCLVCGSFDARCACCG